ncbi:UNVERIFIED_CONTAM: APO protein 1, chloroplastic [Sesamum latifolium]|uniref:APO protein 1, chloroplastic n=1 Tax=Sesamum latifolium TaxID=2727402 RepID=A0AAW2WAX7_9LAMI
MKCSTLVISIADFYVSFLLRQKGKGLLGIMLQQLPVVSFATWTSSNTGTSLGLVEFKMSQLAVSKSSFSRAKGQFLILGYLSFQEPYLFCSLFYCFGCSNPIARIRPGIFSWTYERPNHGHSMKKRKMLQQNVDLPPILPKKKKKPYPIPLKKIQQVARADKKLAQMGIEKLLEPPKNGLLVPELIPVAYEVLDAWKVLIGGLAQILHVVPVHACSECSEIHVAQIGHDIQDCHGPTSGSRKSFHSWVKGSINDVLLPIESYHMYDPFGRRIKHETRFNYDRIPAVVELCIQAGVELPEYPSRRRTEPIRMIGKKVTDIGGFVEEPAICCPSGSGSQIMELDTHQALVRFPPPNESAVPMIAQHTVNAYEKVKWGVTKLMKKYSVKACGYCSEVHVGPWGHNAKLCGEFKHQWRDGKHGWQDATVDEVFPPNYVWHVKDPKGPPLTSALKRFYGKAPAVVEVCIQAGARVPNRYKPMMRDDIVVPEDKEARLVA